MYKMSNLAYGTFRTKTYTPVKQVTNRATTIPEEISQIGLQDSSTPGQILNIAVDNGGVNYTSAYYYNKRQWFGCPVLC